MKLCPACKQEFDAGEQFCPFDGSRLGSASALRLSAVEDDPFINATIADRYLITRCIGSGGMGVVYEAKHTTLGRKFAVKILRPQVSTDADVVQRFQIEAKSASRIGHENIIEVTDFGLTLGGAPFMVMEHLDGEDLADVIARERLLSITRGIPIILQCCRALGAAHAKGIVHRDMKPENVFLVHRDGLPDFVKIVDFGIAKISDLDTTLGAGRRLTKTGMIFGTPEYMSTEQAFGRPTDHRSDIYAVGIMMFEMFAGRVPFKGDSFMAILSQHMLDPAPRVHDVNPKAGVPQVLQDVIAKTLEKDPNDRFQSMRELHEGILRACEAEGIAHLVTAHSTDTSWVGPMPQAAPAPAPTDLAKLASASAKAGATASASRGAATRPGPGSTPIPKPVPTPTSTPRPSTEDGGPSRQRMPGPRMPNDASDETSTGAMAARLDPGAHAYDHRRERLPTSRTPWVLLGLVLLLFGGSALAARMDLFGDGDGDGEGDGVDENAVVSTPPVLVDQTPPAVLLIAEDAGVGADQAVAHTPQENHRDDRPETTTVSMMSPRVDTTTPETTVPSTMENPTMTETDPNAPSLNDLHPLPTLNGLEPYDR